MISNKKYLKIQFIPHSEHTLDYKANKPIPARTGNAAIRHCTKDNNPLKTKPRPLYLKVHSYRAVNTFHLGYINHSVYAVSGTSRCLFSDKYKTHKHSVGRAYSC